MITQAEGFAKPPENSHRLQRRRSTAKKIILHTKYFTKPHNYDDSGEAVVAVHPWIQPKAQDVVTAKHNFNCEICLQHGNSSDQLMKCIYCNVVCHFPCLKKFYKSSRYEKQWICFYCVEYLDDSRKTYDEDLKSCVNYELHKNCQIMVAKNFRRYIVRKWYLHIYLLIVRLQVMFHVRRRKKLFMATLQSKLRPMKLRITRCTNLIVAGREANNSAISPLSNYNDEKSLSNADNHGARRKKKDHSFYVLVTTVDHGKQAMHQNLRIPSRIITLDLLPYTSFDMLIDEKIMLPGISGYSILVFSVFQRSIGKDILLGQCGIDLALEHTWRKGGKFSLALGEQDYAIKDHIGMDMKLDTRSVPRGSIEFELFSFNNMTSECGYCHASNAEDLVRTLLKLPEYKGFILPHRSNHGNLLAPSGGGLGGGGSVSKDADDNVSTASTSISSLPSPSAASHRNVVTAHQRNLNLAMGSSDSYALSIKRLWVVIAEGLLYLYSHYGDQLKLIIDLSCFTFSIDYKDAGKTMVYKIHRNGYPDFQFHPISNHDNLRWKCAFLCSARNAHGGNNKADGAFDMMTLLHDLWTLESLKPNSRLMHEAQLHASSMTALPAMDSAEDTGMSSSASQPQFKELSKLLIPHSSRMSMSGARQQLRQSIMANMGVHVKPITSIISTPGAALPTPTSSTHYSNHKPFATPKARKKQTLRKESVGMGKDLASVTDTDKFFAVGAKLLTDKIKEESSLEDIVTNDKYQQQGEKVVQILMSAIAEKRQLLKKTRHNAHEYLNSTMQYDQLHHHHS